MSTPTLISVKNIQYTHPGADKPLFKDFSLGLEQGKCHVFLGRSGGGKSTLLRLIAGLIKPEQGRIETAEKDVPHGSWQQFLFQDYDCFPWLTVFENIQRGSGPPPYASKADVQTILNRVGLAGKEDLYPRALSGGMRKRLGFARTLVRRPRLLLLDEPFASLDIALRNDMYELLQELISEHGTTVLLVSHDLHEALVLGDHIHMLGDCPAVVAETLVNPFPHPRSEDIVQQQAYSVLHKKMADRLKNAA